MNDENPIIRIHNVSRNFGHTKALDGVELDVYPGRIVGLLGANAAGKSTLLRHIIGLYLPDSGSCTTFGCDAAKLGPAELGRIGYVHQEGELLDWMTVGQLIRYVSAYYAGWNRDLEEAYTRDYEIPLKARVGSLSPGQRQKLAILLAIGFEPELLILDEPAAALDPVARANFLNLLLKIIQSKNRTIIISSHILSDVEKVIDHVVIMKSGRVITDCSFDELREEFHSVRVSSLGERLPEQLSFGSVVAERRSNEEAILSVRGSSEEEIRARAKALNCWVEIGSLPLEDIYRISVR